MREVMIDSQEEEVVVRKGVWKVWRREGSGSRRLERHRDLEKFRIPDNRYDSEPDEPESQDDSVEIRPHDWESEDNGSVR